MTCMLPQYQLKLVNYVNIWPEGKFHRRIAWRRPRERPPITWLFRMNIRYQNLRLSEKVHAWNFYVWKLGLTPSLESLEPLRVSWIEKIEVKTVGINILMHHKLKINYMHFFICFGFFPHLDFWTLLCINIFYFSFLL